jgi:hypothetical protein
MNKSPILVKGRKDRLSPTVVARKVHTRMYPRDLQGGVLEEFYMRGMGSAA